MRYKYQEATFGGIMLLAGLLLLLHTFSEQYQNLLTGNQHISLMCYPRVILAGWCAMAIGMCWNACKVSDQFHKVFNWKSVLLALGMLGLLVVGINFAGFLLTAGLFFLCFSLFLGYRRKWVAALSAVVVPCTIYFVFDELLGVMLPTPLWQLGG